MTKNALARQGFLVIGVRGFVGWVIIHGSTDNLAAMCYVTCFFKPAARCLSSMQHRIWGRRGHVSGLSRKIVDFLDGLRAEKSVMPCLQGLFESGFQYFRAHASCERERAHYKNDTTP